MAVCQNSSLLYLDEEDTVLAIRLAAALQYDEVEIFLEIYDSIPSSRELQRVRQYVVAMQTIPRGKLLPNTYTNYMIMHKSFLYLAYLFVTVFPLSQVKHA